MGKVRALLFADTPRSTYIELEYDNQGKSSGLCLNDNSQGEECPKDKDGTWESTFVRLAGTIYQDEERNERARQTAQRFLESTELWEVFDSTAPPESPVGALSRRVAEKRGELEQAIKELAKLDREIGIGAAIHSKLMLEMLEKELMSMTAQETLLLFLQRWYQEEGKKRVATPGAYPYVTEREVVTKAKEMGVDMDEATLRIRVSGWSRQ